MTKVKLEKRFMVYGISMYHESFPDECSVQQWLSLALSIRLKQRQICFFPYIWIKSSDKEPQNFSLA